MPTIQHEGLVELVRQYPPLGEAVGEARTRADVILRVLESRGLLATRAQQKLIRSSTNLDELDAWFDRSLTAASVEEIFGR